MNKQISTSKEDKAVKDLIDALHNFVNQTLIIAEKLLYIKTNYPHRMPEIRDALGGQLSSSLEANLLSFAHGDIVPEMVTDTSAVANTIKQFDKGTQEQYYVNQSKVEVLGSKEMTIFEMDKEQRDMVFDTQHGEIRSLKQQSRYHEKQIEKQKEKAKKEEQYYLIHDDSISIYKKCTLSLPNLYWIIEQIEKNIDNK